MTVKCSAVYLHFQFMIELSHSLGFNSSCVKYHKFLSKRCSMSLLCQLPTSILLLCHKHRRLRHHHPSSSRNILKTESCAWNIFLLWNFIYRLRLSSQRMCCHITIVSTSSSRSLSPSCQFLR